MSKNCKKYTQSQYPMRNNGATLGQFRTKCFTRNTMAETVVLFCILYCGKLVTKCVSDSLAQTTLKISDSLAQIHIKKVSRETSWRYDIL